MWPRVQGSALFTWEEHWSEGRSVLPHGWVHRYNKQLPLPHCLTLWELSQRGWRFNPQSYWGYATSSHAFMAGDMIWALVFCVTKSTCTASGTVPASLLPLQGWLYLPWIYPCQPRNGGRIRFWRDPAAASREFFRVTSLRKQSVVPTLALPFYQLFRVYLSAHNMINCFVNKYKANGRWENWKIYLRE